MKRFTACVAKAFDRKLIQNPEALRRMQAYYANTDLELNEARLRMTYAPEDAVLIDNPISVAPGFRIENVYVMAGVPKIMRAMLDGVKGELMGGASVLSRSVTCSLGEGTIAVGLGEIQSRYPEVDIGSYPRFGSNSYKTTLVLRHTDAAVLETVLAEVCTLVRAYGGEPLLDVDEAD